MRVRIVAISVCLLMLTGVAVLAGSSLRANAQDATPTTAATPVAEGTPAATPVNVVTLVGWYSPDPTGDRLLIGPLRTNDNLVAGPADVTDRSLTGDADFSDPGNDGNPRITLGDSAFNAVPSVDDDPDTIVRGLYPEDDSSLRPATLVLRIVAVKGPYDGYTGTATFVSRAIDAGGVIVIVLNPPS
jgi:hypothetical protein